MPNAVETGMRAQQAAETYLMNKGCVILARNYRSPGGEIDLIIRDDAYIAFVEVKYRTGLQYGYPREAVHTRKQRHIKKTALFYIARHHLANQDFRFDVVELFNHMGQIHITHIQNAFS